jgi:sugar phosphate isomerase/epimerase
VEHLRATAIFAAEMGAGAMVVHGGYAAMRPLTPRLIRLLARGREGSWWWNRTWNALDRRRTRRVPAALDDLRRGLDKLLPDLERLNVTLALENLPSLEAVPSEIETLDLLAAYPSPRIAAWYDFGHGQIRENLGFVNAARLLERIAPRLAGFHIHDVAPPATDHLPPGRGAVEYARFRDVVRGAGKLPLVIEPQRDASAGDLRSGMDYLRTVWSGTAPG